MANLRNTQILKKSLDFCYLYTFDTIHHHMIFNFMCKVKGHVQELKDATTLNKEKLECKWKQIYMFVV